jgi:hypothetical protein
MPCFVLYGDSGMGKTMIVEKFERMHPAHHDKNIGTDTKPATAISLSFRTRKRVTGSWGCAVRRRLSAQCRNSSDLLLSRRIASLAIAPEDQPDAIARCSPPGSGYSLISGNPAHCAVRSASPSSATCISKPTKSFSAYAEEARTCGRIVT